jgi:hypothetical protein
VTVIHGSSEEKSRVLAFMGLASEEKHVAFMGQVMHAFKAGKAPSSDTKDLCMVWERRGALLSNLAGDTCSDRSDFIWFGSNKVFWPGPLIGGDEPSAAWVSQQLKMGEVEVAIVLEELGLPGLITYLCE